MRWAAPRCLGSYALVLSTVLASAGATGAEVSVAGSDLADLSLEELSNLEVTTVAKRAERLSDAPASVYVITGEDIRRSGATSLGEALQLAPNLEVAQVNNSNFAVSSRGFLNLVTNKLLVLIDGRTVYSPILSGVFWNAQQVMLEDVERIEVISGPGAALSGANAFDGVINIITKSAADTQGGVVLAGVGNEQRDQQMRYGGLLGDAGAYRIYAMHTEDSGSSRTDGSSEDDAMRRDQVGFRADLGAGDGTHSTLQGDLYQASIGAIPGTVTQLSGGNILGRTIKDLDDGSQVSIQSYYDHVSQDDPVGIRDTYDVLDLEVQDDLPDLGAQKISFGGGYRLGYDQTMPNLLVRFVPQNRSLKWGNLFVQDELALTSNVKLTAGLKVETDVYTPPQVMPDLRLAWKPRPDQLVWAALSDAVRTPARIDRDFYFPGNPPYVIRGSDTFRSETAHVLELGYRAQPGSRLSFSVNAYYNQLDHLRSGEPSPLGGYVIANGMSGYGTGLEAWGSVQVNDALRLSFGVNQLRQNLHLDAGSLDPTGPSALGNDPRHTVKLRALYTLSPLVDCSVSVRYVSALSYLQTVPAYNATDLNLRWHVSQALDLSFSILDAFHAQHVEWADSSGAPGVIPRTFYAQAKVRF